VAANVGLATVAAGNRLLFIDGVQGIYIATSATAATLSNTGADAVQLGKKVKVTTTTSGPVEYWQTAATGSGTAVFVRSTSGNVAVSNANLFWSRDNVYLSGSSWASMLCPGAYVDFSFYGTQCLANIAVNEFVSAVVSAANYPFVRYRIDGGSWVEAQLTSATTTVGATGLTNARHHFELQYTSNANNAIDPWTATASGWPLNSVAITSFTVDDPKLISRTVAGTTYARFDGDSITSGDNTRGTDGTAASKRNWEEWSYLFAHQMISFGEIDAYSIVAYGGTSYGAANVVPSHPNSADYYFANTLRVTSGRLANPPAFWFMNLGANDGSTDLSQILKRDIEDRRYAAGPNCDIIIVVPFNGTERATIVAAVENYIAAHSDDSRVHLLDTGTSISDYNSLDGLHPSAAGAATIATLVRTKFRAALLGVAGLETQVWDPATNGSLTIVAGGKLSAMSSLVGTNTASQATDAQRLVVSGIRLQIMSALAANKSKMDCSAHPAIVSSGAIFLVVRIVYTGGVQLLFEWQEGVIYSGATAGSNWTVYNSGGAKDAGASIPGNEWTLLTLYGASGNHNTMTNGGTLTNYTGSPWTTRNAQRWGCESDNASNPATCDYGAIICVGSVVLTAAQIAYTNRKLCRMFGIKYAGT
jgi:hypothetical protein